MSISIEEFITDFAYKLNNEQVSVFIGSGVSTELKLPNWKDLFKDIAAKISLNIDELTIIINWLSTIVINIA